MEKKKYIDNTEDYQQVTQARHRRKIIRNIILAFCILLLPVFIYWQKKLLSSGVSDNNFDNILIFVVININIILFLLLLFLVLRNLAEFIFDEHGKYIGTKLKTKIVFSFFVLTLFPALLFFFVSFKFVSTSMDYWFNVSVEESLTESLSFAQSILQNKKRQAEETSHFLISKLQKKKYNRDGIEDYFSVIFAYYRTTGLDLLRLVSRNEEIDIVMYSPRLHNTTLPEITPLFAANLQQEKVATIDTIQQGALVSVAVPFQFHSGENVLLISSMLVPRKQLEKMNTISRGIENYRQLKYFQEPFRFGLVIILLIITILVVFIAVWFAFYISRGLTSPLEKLVYATKQVADGDLEFEIKIDRNDEMGQVMHSFNQMTTRLNRSKRELAQTHSALRLSSQESEQRRRYIEIILQNVSAGVISVEKNGVITTINRFATTLLQIDTAMFLGRNFTEVLPPYQAEIVRGFISELEVTGKNMVEQHIRLNVMGKTFSLLINFSRLENEEKELVGYVLVFDNLTKLEKMQRIAAWREVARRIAHEIKNPLTPIQLSAQRLRRRYPEIVAEENSIFDQCTNTIIVQVDELKRLVNEFSQFARMPKVQKSENNLVELARETLVLYREAHREIDFTFTPVDIPSFFFDYEQIKRCLINLLDNAIAVLPDGGHIAVILRFDSIDETVFIEIIDNGPGITKEDKMRLFEPYFSTKKSGTGLGLAIVSTIVSDHNGYIRVQDNIQGGKGSCFIIELPFRETTIL